MKEIFDRRYPVTSFFLLVTTLVFILMFLTSGFNYTSAATLYQFGAIYPPAIKAMPEQIWRLFSATFVHIGLEHFFSQHAIPLLFGASDGANLWLQAVFLYLPLIRYDGESLCPSF